MTVVQIPDAEESFIYHGAKKTWLIFIDYIYFLSMQHFSAAATNHSLCDFLNLHTPKTAQNHRFSTDN